MIPTRPSSEIQNIDVTGNEVSVRGSRPKCGKTTLACMLAAKESEYRSVQVVVDEHIISNIVPYYNFLADNLGIPEPLFSINSRKEDGYDLTIYDTKKVVDVNEVIYIVPPLNNDPELGVIDKANTELRHDIAVALGDTSKITFVDSDLVNNVNANLLNATDWMVIRELERMYLHDTDLGVFRNFLRKGYVVDGMPVGIKL